jgi:hypothetical protein
LRSTGALLHPFCGGCLMRTVVDSSIRLAL